MSPAPPHCITSLRYAPMLTLCLVPCRLERQRAVLEDELVATKEELVFIRAQLQVSSFSPW